MALPPTSSRIDGKLFTQLENLNIYGLLYVNGVPLPIGGNAGQSFSVSGDYTVLETDFNLLAKGGGVITVPTGRPNPITIAADDAVVTVVPTPRNKPATIPMGSSYTMVWNEQEGEYIVQ